MAKLYLHIGTLKTGTTSIQHLLEMNRSTLNKRGYCYPEIKLRGVRAHRNASFIVHRPILYDLMKGTDPEKLYFEYWDEAFDMIAKEASRYPNLIMSEEDLWFWKARLKTWDDCVQSFKEAGIDEIKVIVYLRRQDDLLDSHYNQRVKGPHKLTADFQTFVDKKLYAYARYDYADRLDELSKVFGKENICVRVFEREQFKDGSLYSDFLAQCDIEYDKKSFVSDDFVTNEKLNGNLLEIKRRINGVNSSKNVANIFGMIGEDLDPKVEGQSMMSREEHLEFLKQYEEQNERVAREYLGREDGKLFYKEPKDKPKWKIEESEILGDSIEIFASVLFRQEERIKEMEMQVQSMYNSPVFRAYRKVRKKLKGREMYILSLFAAAALALGSLTACGGSSGENAQKNESVLTNVSYDPTRELYEEYNDEFEDYYKEKTGKDVDVVMSHGGSGSQARSVIEGADADVVTLALAHDITMVEQAGLIDSGWQSEFDRDSSPYTSTIVFLVRKGNPKKIKDWNDLTRKGVEVITPDPKSSGAAMWNFLAAWNYAEGLYNKDEAKCKAFMKSLYGNVKVMDSGARGSTTTFVENGQGDVLVSWENEAIATKNEYPDDYEIISPSKSILAQPSVAIVDENASKDQVEDVAKEYLEYLYTNEGQKIIGENGYRPSDENVLEEFKDKFDLNIKLCTIEDYGGWDKAYETYFADGGVFDEIME